MKKKTLNEGVEAYKISTNEALQMLWDEINHGQQKQILKNENVKRVLDTYGVIYEP